MANRHMQAYIRSMYILSILSLWIRFRSTHQAVINVISIYIHFLFWSLHFCCLLIWIMYTLHVMLRINFNLLFSSLLLLQLYSCCLCSSLVMLRSSTWCWNYFAVGLCLKLLMILAIAFVLVIQLILLSFSLYVQCSQC